MGRFKRCLTNFSFLDQKTIEKKLEQMAADGWILCKAGNLFWTYEKTEAKKLRFAVTYFPGASELDPYPDEKQRDKEMLCARDGWRLLMRWDAMQIFCTDREDAVPLETDPVPQVANIHRTMKKKLFTGHAVEIISLLWFLFLEISEFFHDPVIYLSSSSHLLAIPLWLILLFGEIYQICSYFRWQRKAKKAAEDGIFLPIHTNKFMAWCLVVIAVVLLVFIISDSNTHFLLMLSFMAVVAVSYFICIKLMAWLKKKGFPKQVNLLLSSVSVMLLTLIGVALIISAGISGTLPVSRDSQPVGTYEWDGHSFDIYDDPLPLTVEELTGLEARWSKRARLRESPVLSYGNYSQDILFTENIGNYEFKYEITDVKLDFLYGFIKNRLVNSRQDEVHDDVVFTDHYEPIDPTLWNAGEAYQLHWSDSLLDTYLVCWENRIVEIKFYWSPTPEQVVRAAEILSP